MVLQSLFPVFALIALGVLLKHFNLTNDNFLKTSDKLIYFMKIPQNTPPFMAGMNAVRG